MKLRWFQLVSTSRNSISTFFKIFGLPCFSTRENLSIDVSMTNVELILTKLRWSQLFSTSKNTRQNSISNFFEKKKKIIIFGFLCCSTRENLSIDASITNVWLILTKLWWLHFSGMDRQMDKHTDTVLESSYGNMSSHKNFQLKISG